MALDDDVQVSDVLGQQPSEETVDALVAGDVIPPERASGRGGRPAAERDEDVIELLQAILEELETDAVAQEDGV